MRGLRNTLGSLGLLQTINVQKVRDHLSGILRHDLSYLLTQLS